MTRFLSLPLLPLALLVALAACSPDADQQAANGASETSAPAASSVSAPVASPDVGSAPGSRNVIGLEGLGDLRIGEAVPEGGSFAERGAQTSEACRTVSSPDYPGVYAIVADGKVQRITVGQRSDVKLAEGVGVSSSEKEVRSWFGGFREEPHKYEEAPAKYLTAPNAESGSSALRFEIGRDGKVKLFHIGVMPYLAYVEACA
ncbi:hypothetical protein NYQ83_11025 [Afifella sp. JA880]|uniref:hypothetical protein n=1 Tax=Afifella sp. JA880 TaxID=2975280 RepID=UPI0021BA7B25|nr:hypothetical protein [Afifella sp. JA880]MCT8267804.1 hypothetical protein [Afifella sp. JA880]